MSVDIIELIRKADTIKHSGDYGVLFFNTENNEVWLTLGDDDGDPENEHTSFEEIKSLLKIPGVSEVTIGDETFPVEGDENVLLESPWIALGEHGVAVW